MSATIIAAISTEWKRRMLIIAGVLGAMACWFFFDGLIAYPRQNARAAAYAELKQQHGEGTPELEAAWTALRNERAWSADVPKKTFSPDDIRMQIILACLGLALAGAVLFTFFRSLPRTTRLEGGQIILPDGRKIPLDKVVAIGKRRWESKSIADLAYESSPGVTERFILDDYKYAGARDILAEVEKVLPAEAGGAKGATPAAEQKPE